MFGDFRFLLFFCVLLRVCADTLPLFILQRHQPTPDEALALAEGLFGPDDYNLTLFDERYIVLSSDCTKRVEYDTISGGIWAADESELWNTTGGPPEDLPSEDDAIRMAKELVAQLNLLPEEAGPLTITGGRTSGTFLAHESEDGSGGYKREGYSLDISANFELNIVLKEKEFPIVGGGGKFQVTYGRCKKLIAFQGLWREIVGKRPYTIISQEEAEAQYLESLGYVAAQGVVTFNASLAYFSEPYGNVQKKMYPVWVFDGQAVIGGETIGIRPQTLRGSEQTTSSVATALKRRRSLSHLHTRSLDDNNTFEAGAEYLGAPYGLLLAEDNTAGFRNGIYDASPPWTYAYEKSNGNVLESDFTSDDDRYVDAVDLLFYVGHANRNGWMANAGPGTGVQKWVNYTSFGARPDNNPGDLLGHQDLEWLIIGACGPLQDEVVRAGDGNVFDRWRGIFDGLHTMFAYATPSYDSVEEGARFTKYAQEGYNLIDAWFRTAKDAQPPEVTVAVMWTDDARADHLPGYGYVSDDNPAGSRERWAMWTTS